MPLLNASRSILGGLLLLLLASCASKSAVPPGDVDSGDPKPALNPVATHGQLAVVGNQLQDASGQPVQLKGVSSQWLNFESRGFPESKEALLGENCWGGCAELVVVPAANLVGGAARARAARRRPA